MEDKKISFETAKLAKEKGFDGYTLDFYGLKDKSFYEFKMGQKYELINHNHEYYSNRASAPTQSLLAKWLRDVHELEISIETSWKDITKKRKLYSPWVYYREDEDNLEDGKPEYFDTYEKALEMALVEALHLVKKKFYRVCNEESLRGLWYDFKGEFTGIIHEDFDFCLNSSLKMNFDPEIVGWLSATDSLEDLYKWFTKSDIIKLQNFGWYIHEFEATDYKFYERFQHLIINQNTSKLIRKIEL